MASSRQRLAALLPLAPSTSGRTGRLGALRRRAIRIKLRAVFELNIELEELVAAYAPQLLAEPGCGPLTAAKLIGEIAGAERFETDAKLARMGAAAPVAASSGSETAIASTVAATASSTWRFIASPSTGASTAPRAPPTSSASMGRENRARRRCGPSSVSSPGAC